MKRVPPILVVLLLISAHESHATGTPRWRQALRQTGQRAGQALKPIPTGLVRFGTWVLGTGNLKREFQNALDVATLLQGIPFGPQPRLQPVPVMSRPRFLQRRDR